MKNTLSFHAALKSFFGYLEGTDKAFHTQKSYKRDLEHFYDFLKKHFGKSEITLMALTHKDLMAYYESLKTEKLKTNTRRRRLLTVRRFFRYLQKRKKFHLDVSEQILAPAKVERVPKTLSFYEFFNKVVQLSEESPLHLRTKLLFWVLLETGCRVSEASRLKYQDVQGDEIRFFGKSPRTIRISKDLSQKITLSKRGSEWIFLGFNRFGVLSQGPISDRGIEILIKETGKRLGIADLTPRMLRHSTILHWCKEGVDRREIQSRLGLKSAYAFRVYEPILDAIKSNAETTSSATNENRP